MVGVGEWRLRAIVDGCGGVVEGLPGRVVSSWVREAPSRLTAADAQAVRDAGWTDDDLFDALSVGALFNFMNRMVDGAGIATNPDYHAVSAERLESGGYEAVRSILEQNG